MRRLGDCDTVSRREALWRLGGGFGGVALATMLGEEAARAEPRFAGGGLHHPAKAKRVIQLFMSGAASQCDTFDYKPRLERDHGKPWNPGEKVELFQSAPDKTMKAPWKWKQYGACGKWINDSVAPLGDYVDEMAFIHNMVSRSNVHGPATYLQATGFVLPGFPSMGAWISYGLGRITDDLPTFVVLPDPRGFPPNGPKNWGAGFLPAQHQATPIYIDRPEPISNLKRPDRPWLGAERDALSRELLAKLNRAHQLERPADTRLEARIRAYELAARLQVVAPEVLDWRREPKSVIERYGADARATRDSGPMNEGDETRYFGRNCLIARRLLERGVRFVQIWSGADNGFPRRNWDSHEDLRRDHWPLGRGMARGAAALIHDLRERGMLEDTIILWTTEFGRMPCSQGQLGRDHNPTAFTNWLCGGGIRGGVTVGESDEWSFKSQDPDQPTTVYDVHATILYLLGIDHRRLTFRHNGVDRRLTDVHGHLINEIVA